MNEPFIFPRLIASINIVLNNLLQKGVLIEILAVQTPNGWGTRCTLPITDPHISCVCWLCSKEEILIAAAVFFERRINFTLVQYSQSCKYFWTLARTGKFVVHYMYSERMWRNMRKLMFQECKEQKQIRQQDSPSNIYSNAYSALQNQSLPSEEEIRLKYLFRVVSSSRIKVRMYI